MELSKEIIDKLNDFKIELADLEQKLSYEEVLADKKLTTKFQTRQNKLINIISKYDLLQKLQNEINTLNPNEQQIFCDDIEDVQSQISLLTENLLNDLLCFEQKIEFIVLEIEPQKSSADFSKKLLTAYIKMCELAGFKYEVNGNKLLISGDNLIKLLSQESGVHKCNNQQLKVYVYPYIPFKQPTFEDKDLEIDVHHSSGAGGQNINKVATAVRITHLPTGISVNCQDERSQFQNKVKALEQLKEKVNQKVREQNLNTNKELKRDNNNDNVVKIYNFAKNELFDCVHNKAYNLTNYINTDILNILKSNLIGE